MGKRDDFKLNQSFGNEDFLLEGIETDKSTGNIDGIDSINSDDTDQPNETKRNVCFDDTPRIRFLPSVDDDSVSTAPCSPPPQRRSSQRQKQVLSNPESLY